MHNDDYLSFEEFTSFADFISNKGAEIALSKYNGNFGKWDKLDGTVVTEVDLEIETLIRGEITNKYPKHSIHGEEEEDVNKNSDYRWIIDPIDGTLNFAAGIPFYGILLGLCFQGKIIYGSYRLPSYNNIFVSGDGRTCCSNTFIPEKKISSTDTTNSLFLTTDEDRVSSSKYAKNWKELKKDSISRSWGDCFGYHMVLSGKADAMLDLNLKECDIMPLIPIIKASGYSIINLSTKKYVDLIVCDPRLEEKIQIIFNL